MVQSNDFRNTVLMSLHRVSGRRERGREGSRETLLEAVAFYLIVKLSLSEAKQGCAAQRQRAGASARLL